MRVKPACSTGLDTAVFMMLSTFYAVCGLSFVAGLSINRELNPSLVRDIFRQGGL